MSLAASLSMLLSASLSACDLLTRVKLVAEVVATRAMEAMVKMVFMVVWVSL